MSLKLVCLAVDWDFKGMCFILIDILNKHKIYRLYFWALCFLLWLAQAHVNGDV